MFILCIPPAGGALVHLSYWPWVQVRFSEGGERFAAIGQGGMAAAWRLDAPTFTRSDSGPLARSDWCHQARLTWLRSKESSG